MVEIKKDLRWCWHCAQLIPEGDMETHLDENPTHFICEGVGTESSAGGVEINPFKAQDFEASNLPTDSHHFELSTQGGLGWKRYSGHVHFPYKLNQTPTTIKFEKVCYVGMTASLQLIRGSLSKRGFRFQVRALSVVPLSKGEITAAVGQTTGVSFNWEAIT